jgi:hypothetical protein
MLLYDVERPCRERTDTVIDLLSSLVAATFQLTAELCVTHESMANDREGQFFGLRAGLSKSKEVPK